MKRSFTIHASRREWPLGRFAGLDALGAVRHGVSTRRGPFFGRDASAPASARAADSLARTVDLAGAVWCRQVHGGQVVVAEEAGLVGEGDGLVTAVEGLGLLGRSADCPLILLAGRRSGGGWAVGLAHASWRSTALSITARTVAALREHCSVDPADIRAAVCPSAGPGRYEVGQEVRDRVTRQVGPHAEAFFIERAGGLFFDLWAANADQLERAGVPPGAIEVAGFCTLERPDLFWSHRVEGERAGRFAAVIGVRRRSSG